MTLSTPEPWHISSSGHFIRADLPGAPDVAQVYGRSVGEHEANAALLVTAPKLANALEEWLAAEDEFSADPEEVAAGADRIIRAREAARLALAEARGERSWRST